MPRRTVNEMEIASWFDTEALTRNGLPDVELELPALSEEEAEELTAALRSDEVQGALQMLLAASSSSLGSNSTAGGTPHRRSG